MGLGLAFLLGINGLFLSPASPTPSINLHFQIKRFGMG
jgi:hypothetical protein